jgi:hypothetical protein
MHNSAIFEENKRKAAQRKQKVLERRKKIRMFQIKEAIQSRDTHLPLATAILSFGVFLILFRLLIGFLSFEIESGKISNRGGIIGPIKIESSEFHELKLNYNLRGLNSKWCAIDVLILDENKNYVSGAAKDLYYELDGWGNVYQEDAMNYSVEISNPGTYYYQLVPNHSNKSKYLGKSIINYELNKLSLGRSFVLFFGILLTISGALYLSWTILDWELTPYLPNLKSDLSKNKFKLVALVLGPVVLLIITCSIFKIGSADLENAPSSYFSADNTIYFGK